MTAHSSALTAISPIDGRYQPKIQPLAQFFSEYALIKYRVIVEIEWLKSLSESKDLKEIQTIPQSSINKLNTLAQNFSVDDALAVKTIEQTTNHDVKAVEYWLRQTLKTEEDIAPITPFIHFACTSEDINNLAYALMLKGARDKVLIPKITTIISTLADLSVKYAKVPMLSRTHGQPASPTTAGKEIANIVYRLERQMRSLAQMTLQGKMNGAVGNFNAHLSAYPDYDWEAHSQKVINGLGLEPIPYTTQIEPHDGIAELFDCLMRINTILIDLNRDLWGYISIGYFKQKVKSGEVGSSTMPHKVNPIDFENSEGNLGLSNAVLEHLSRKLPISRWQRDLTDSTVLRNMGVGLGYGLLAYDSCLKGLLKIDINLDKLNKDLDQCWDVLAEPVQTVMKKYGIENAYEQLKDLTRGQGGITKPDLHKFIKSLTIPDDAKKRLLDLTPQSYTGIAQKLAQSIKK
ncbi:MAG: adenylosuccinate lyase [Proteobacteria bacterium]|nr:adenylosuccinate lyase [Pseudomonadota bacterium]MDA1330917.1 adenylosuccinate lyase [Pseudomonadota bacterium]